MTRRWSSGAYLSAPHRLFFPIGGLVLAASSVWWAYVQGSAGAPAAYPRLPPVGVHAVAMTLGFFPMFFAGFIFTTGLKWLRVPAVPMTRLAPAAAAHLSGCAVGAAAVAWQDERLFGAGVALVAAGCLHAVCLLAGAVRARGAQDGLHATVFLLAGVLGAAAAGACAWACWTQRWVLVLAVARASVWGFVGLTFVGAAHRMVPFVSGTGVPHLDERWPRLMLIVLAGTLACRTAAEIAPAIGRISAPLELAVGLALLATGAGWGVRRTLRPRILKMLFTGFLWLGASFALSGVNGLWPGATGGAVPLHAFAAGFLGTTMLTLLSRVSAAAAGRVQAIDGPLWGLFLGLQAAVLLRVAGPWGAAVLDSSAKPFLVAGALLWASVWILWTSRYGRMLGLTSADSDGRAAPPRRFPGS